MERAEDSEVYTSSRTPLLADTPDVVSCNINNLDSNISQEIVKKTPCQKSTQCSSNQQPTTVDAYCKNNNINKPYQSSLIINTHEFNQVVEKLRAFFVSRNFLEVSTQNRLSILAACEDPFNVGIFDYAGQRWPLPQTGQMWLEYELLKNPEPEGYFCLTTSYRMEENPVENRHDLIFPLFEFEMKGGMDALIQMEKDLLVHLGYDSSKFIEEDYNNLLKLYNTKELEHEHEQKLYDELSPTFFIKNFPEFTSPFWNMKRNNDETANKVDVILSGQETFGSAEREVDKTVMRERFDSIMEGGYKDKLYELFGKERTEAEMEDYLKFDFFERCGGGIGMTRLIRSMRLEGLLV
jgi:aspartyl/asparaginyl-tRNA synthetase